MDGESSSVKSPVPCLSVPSILRVEGAFSFAESFAALYPSLVSWDSISGVSKVIGNQHRQFVENI